MILEDNEIDDKLKVLFGISSKIIPKLVKLIKDLYINTKYKTVSPEAIHRVIINFFANDYYPLVSKNININKYNYPVISGGIAFNINIPAKLSFYKIDTEDVDLKIYTTSINYIEKTEKVLPIFQNSIIIICVYLKQVLELIKIIINDFDLQTNKKKVNTVNIVKTVKYKPIHKLKKIKYTQKVKPIAHKSIEHKPKYIKTKIAKPLKNIAGSVGGGNDIIDIYSKGILSKYQIKMQIKKRNDYKINEVVDNIDLTNITYSYSNLFDKIVNIINDPDLLITIKVGYVMRNNNKATKIRNITFSDTEIYYPCNKYPTFYAYYLMNNHIDLNKTIEQLINYYIPLDKIMETKSCGNNCKYLSIKTLLLDTTLMLSYADLLAYENLPGVNDITDNDSKHSKHSKHSNLVPMRLLYKYYKYVIKYLRLFIIKKYYEGKLTGKFQSDANRLSSYVWQHFNIQTSIKSETEKVNIEYKILVHNFHQNLFINKTLLKEYPELIELVNEYTIMTYYINKSRSLFKALDDKSGHSGETLESLTIQMADQELSKRSDEISKLTSHQL